MVGRTKEQGLSEVIGFLMIVALLGTLFSMYLIYVVPIQGKDAEISHMKYITQQFIDIKSDIDSLIINDRINIPIARSFELGTLSSSGQGSLSIIPIQSFLEAAGTLVVNEQMDNFTVRGVFKTYNEPSYFMNVVNHLHPDWVQIFNDREHLYVYYPGINTSNSSIKGNITYSVENGTFHIFNETRYFINESVTGDKWGINTTNNPANLPEENKTFSIRQRTDIILEIYNHTPDGDYLQYQRTLLENAYPGGHLFDLYDGNEITINNSSFLNYTHASALGTDDTNPSASDMVSSTWESILQIPHRLGSLQYWSQNRYWINQELLYEMGGLFLKQNEGVSIMLIPSLAVTPVPPKTTDGVYRFRVSLVDVAITDTNDVSGTKSAQVFAKVDSVTKNQFDADISATPEKEVKNLAPNQGNSKFLAIRFTPDIFIDQKIRESTTKLWKRAFDQVKVITMKTMSERGLQGKLKMDDIMKTYYINDPTAIPNEDLSANLLIGNYNGQGLSDTSLMSKDSYTGAGCAQEFLDDLNKVTQLAANDPTDRFQPFTFEYSKAMISLVMQSGAM
jgi:hypothetical protein